MTDIITLKIGVEIFSIEDKVFGKVRRRNAKNAPPWVVKASERFHIVEWADGIWTTESKTFCGEPYGYIVVEDKKHKLYLSLKYGVEYGDA